MGILLQYTVGFMARHYWAWQVRSVLSRILLCRTAPLGGHVYQCPQCHEKTHLYNSCADRHCPQCGGAKRADWLDKTAQLLLPKIDYFQVIFTLPDLLSGLALGNRRQLYKLLFQSAWQSLDETLRQSGHFRSAALMVLHTWNQQLDHHPHIHALVPGGGPALDGREWVTSKHPTQRRRKKPYLTDNRTLGKLFREKFILGLRRLVKLGKLKLDGVWSDLLDTAKLDEFIEDLRSTDWNVFVEGPPDGRSDPEHVLMYLARYMTGGPIADSRLISVENDQVTFWARPKVDRPGQPKRTRRQPEPFTLECIEFVRRWAMHILPKGFTKTRRYGGYSGSRCDAYLQLCMKLLNLQPQDLEPELELATSDSQSEPEPLKCSRCDCELTFLSYTARPSWRIVFERIYLDADLYNPAWHVPRPRPKSTLRSLPQRRPDG